MKGWKLIATVFAWVIVGLGIYYGVEGCFYLMNLKDSLMNVAGLCILVLMCLLLFLYIIHKIKPHKK